MFADARSPSRDLLTYGLLMCEDIMTEVAGTRLSCEAAILHGYHSFWVKEKHYPGVVAEAMIDCYLFRPEFSHRLISTEWDFTAFLQGGKTLFQQQYCGFKVID